MQHVLEYALDRAEYIVESARQRPAKRRASSGGKKSLYQKLYELYIEECDKEPELKKLRRNVNLLEKLMCQESVSCLVVNLYPGNQGYSLMLRGKNGSDSETIRLPYEEGQLLEYLDAEELPPILVDLLEKSQPPQLRLYDYLQRRKERKPAPSIDLKISKAGNCVDMWKQSNCQLTVPKEIDVEKYAVVEKSVKLEESQPTVWPAEEVIDDYTFECEVGGKTQRTKVSIFQSVGDPLVYGKIYCAKQPKAEEDSSDLQLIHPAFLIGSKIDADRFLSQYKGVYESDVKCQVKMSHNSGFVGQNRLSPSRETEADGLSALVQSSGVLGKGVKHRPPPIKLPSASGSSSMGNPLSNQPGGNLYSSSQATSGLLKCPTPPPGTGPGSVKPQSLSRKHSVELGQGLQLGGQLGQVGLLSPAALSPMGSTQRSGTPKPSTPTSTPCSTPHPPDSLLSLCPLPSSVNPTPLEPQALLAPYPQQQLSLSQALPVMTIPLPTMGTSIPTGTTSSQVMANPAGLNFINVVGSVCSPQTLMNSSQMLGPGLNLSGLGGLMPTMQPTTQTGSPFGLNSSPGLRPLNLLQIPTGPLIFNSLQQQQLSQFSPQPSQSATSSPQQQGDMV
eukprot:XP_013985257.1 PREDICTED: transcription factor SPT20 homolog [Salmo salar]